MWTNRDDQNYKKLHHIIVKVINVTKKIEMAIYDSFVKLVLLYNCTFFFKMCFSKN